MSKLLEKAQQQPEKSARSILEPHFEVIATLRKKQWTFKEIANFFKEEGIQVSATWLNQYWVLKNGPSKKPSLRKKQNELRKSPLKEEISLRQGDPSLKPQTEIKKPYVHQGDLTDEERKELRQLKANTSSNKSKIWSD